MLVVSGNDGPSYVDRLVRTLSKFLLTDVLNYDLDILEEDLSKDFITY